MREGKRDSLSSSFYTFRERKCVSFFNLARIFLRFLIFLLFLSFPFLCYYFQLLPFSTFFQSLGFNSPLIEWNLGLRTSSVLAARLVADPSARSISVCSVSSTLFNLCFFTLNFLIIQSYFQVRIPRQMKRLQLSS